MGIAVMLSHAGVAWWCDAMKLSVSNIAWNNDDLDEHLFLLRDLGCDGVEIAPSCIWPEPILASTKERNVLRGKIERSKLELVGFHALLFTRPDLQLFLNRESNASTIEYLTKLAELCADLNGRVLILGSPKNRMLHGHDYSQCLQWAEDAFDKLAQACSKLGVIICIEPLAPNETEFIMSAREGAELVKRVSHPNFRLHLDAKALISAEENLDQILDQYGRLLQHFHVGDPGLTPPGSTGANHAPFGRALRRIDYRGYVSIEMRRGEGDTREAVLTSVAYVMKNYLGKELMPGSQCV